MKTTIAVILGLAVLLGLWWNSSGILLGENVVRVKLRDFVFHIPERYSMEGAVPFWLRWTQGLDDGSNEFLFSVSYEEVRTAVPALKGEGPFFCDIVGVV